MTLHEHWLLLKIEMRLKRAERAAQKLKALRDRKQRGYAAVRDARYLAGSIGMQAVKVREMIEEG